MKKLILIKFGGSLISDKTKTNLARFNVIVNLAKQLKSVESVKSAKINFIIATGAGGFGHPVAKKYKNNLEEGLPLIKEAVKKLNQIVVSSLNKAGVKAVSVEPSGIAKYKDGQMTKLLYDYIAKLLDQNIIPVFHADLVDDQIKGISVLSMDKFLIDLAIFFKNKNYKVEKVIFAGTTVGVISRGGTTVRIITINNISKIEEVFYKGKGMDVTGGMKGKVYECLRLIEEKIPCVIINGKKENNLRKAILGEEVKGTIISK